MVGFMCCLWPMTAHSVSTITYYHAIGRCTYRLLWTACSAETFTYTMTGQMQKC